MSSNLRGRFFKFVWPSHIILTFMMGYIVIVNFCEYDVNNYLQGSDTTPPSAGMVEEELQLTRAR